MLVLARAFNEAVVLRIDGEIIAEIKVVQIRENTVKLSFEAKDEVEIIREELLENWRGRS